MKSRAAQGFTLIEVMFALAILATAVFVLLDAHHAAMRLFQASHDLVLERQLHERVLAEAEVQVLAGELTGSGDFGERFPDYAYEYQANLISDERLGLYEVLAVLETPNGRKELTMFVYDTLH